MESPLDCLAEVVQCIWIELSVELVMMMIVKEGTTKVFDLSTISILFNNKFSLDKLKPLCLLPQQQHEGLLSDTVHQQTNSYYIH